MAGRRLFVTALALASLGAPGALQAQATAPAAAPQAVDPRLPDFVKLHAALDEARDEFNAEIAKLHETIPRNEYMETFDKYKAEILDQHGTTELAYNQMLFIVSSDPVQREAFQKLLEELLLER